jgi:hypothetical protein
MKGASYKEVIESMENAEEAHKANPFVRVTPKDKAHVVEDDKLFEEETPWIEDEPTSEEPVKADEEPKDQE